MKMIKITRGGCGIKYTDANGNARHALKTPEDKPFECDDAQADRLVRLRVAEYVGAQYMAVDPETEHIEDQEAPAEEPAETTQEPEKVYGHLSAEDLETWDYNDLKKLAADMGVEPKGKKKADYIAAIVAVEVEHGPEVDPEEVEDPDELPELNAADPE